MPLAQRTCRYAYLQTGIFSENFQGTRWSRPHWKKVYQIVSSECTISPEHLWPVWVAEGLKYHEESCLYSVAKSWDRNYSCALPNPFLWARKSHIVKLQIKTKCWTLDLKPKSGNLSFADQFLTADWGYLFITISVKRKLCKIIYICISP